MKFPTRIDTPESSGTPTLGGDGARDAFWMRVLYGRCLSAVCLCVILAALPEFGPNRAAFAAGFAVASAVQNLVLYQVVRRTGALPQAVAWSDYCFGALVGVILPAAFSWVLIILALTVALLVIGYPSRIAWRLIGCFALPYLAICLWRDPPNWAPAYAIWLICSTSTILIIGLVAEQERSLRQRFSDLLEQLDMVVWESSGAREPTTYVNEQVEAVLGYSKGQWCTPGFWETIIHPADWTVIEESRSEFAAGRSHDLEYRVRTSAGEIRWILELVRVRSGSDGAVIGSRGVMIDITARRDAEQQVQQLGAFVADLPLALHILRMDDLADPLSFRYLAANKAACEQAAVPLERLLAWSPGTSQPANVDMFMLNAYATAIRTGEPLEIDDHQREVKDGTTRRFRIQATPLPDQAIGVSTEDVTEQTEAAQALRYQALHDPLTSLPNRALLHDRLETALAASTRTDQQVALLFMDLNQFKEVNDALGHHHGDRLLIELGKRLQDVVRTSDTVARLGGDEFAVLLTTDVTTRGALETARRISRSFEQPVEIDGVTLQTNVSIGVAMFPEHGTDAEILSQRADIAMYKAKSTGVGVSLYSPEQDRSSIRRLTLMSDLRRAIEDDQLVVYYQPRIDLASGDVVDVEALVRWNHPTHGLLPPSEFIELAEVSGVIQQLTAYVLTTAANEIGGISAAGMDIGVSVNLSVRNLYDPSLLDAVAVALRQSQLDPSKLRVEITESELMDDPALAMEVLGQIRARGIEVSVDDFGTGYSSLSYLRNLPISEIKIDKSFVADLVRGDPTLVKSIIDLGHNLGLSVVAEGVESGPVLRQLADYRCDTAQGFFISRPMPIGELAPFLRRGGDHYRGYTRAGQPVANWEASATQR